MKDRSLPGDEGRSVDKGEDDASNERGEDGYCGEHLKCRKEVKSERAEGVRGEGIGVDNNKSPREAALTSDLLLAMTVES